MTLTIIFGVVNVYNSFYQGRTSRHLEESRVFFYDHFFHVGNDLYLRTLEKVPLLVLTSSDWPLLSSDISEAFYMEIFNEVHKGLKPNVPRQLVKIKVCRSIHIFVDFFATRNNPIALKNTILI